MTDIDLHVSGAGDTLTFAKDNLVTRLKEHLAAKQAERQAAKEKAAARNKEAHDRIVAALDNPSFLVWLVSRIKSNNPDWDPASDTFTTKIAETWPDTDGDDLSHEMDPDYPLIRLIDTYELAENTTVTLTVSDEAYRYLARPKGTAETTTE